MALPLSAPLVISAIQALLRFRGRLDVILSLKEASAALPFALPPAPAETRPHRDDMLAFFQTEKGQIILALKAMEDDFAQVKARPAAPEMQGPRDRLFKLYFEAADVRPTILGPEDQGAAGTGPSTEMRLAYYVVESQRLARNDELTRVLLATADTLLAFAGEHAGLFIAKPQVRGLVETLLDEFAVKRDFDDLGAEHIFKSLLGSAVVAVAENQGRLAERPALKVLFAALADVRDELGDDFVARIISLDGFERLLGTYLTHVAADPAFLVKDDRAQQVLAAMLREVGHNVQGLVEDPGALFGVLEVGLGAAAANVAGLLERELGGRPLLAAVLSALAGEVAARAQDDALFEGIARGDLFTAMYKAALVTIATHPDLFPDETATDRFLADLVTGLAASLAQQALAQSFTRETLRAVSARSLEVLAAHPALLARHSAFATKLIGEVLAAGAQAVRDGFGTEELLSVVEAAVKTASENLALTGLDGLVGAVLSSVGAAVSEGDVRALLTARGRKDALLAALQAVASNPAVWDALAAKGLAHPLVRAVLDGLLSDPTGLLSGPVLVDALRAVLLEAALRGRRLIDEEVSPEAIRHLLTQALDRAGQAIGRSIDGERLPAFLRRVVSEFLKDPFPLPDPGGSRLAVLIAGVLEHFES